MRYNVIMVVLSVLIGAVAILSTDCSSTPLTADVVLYTGEAIGGGIGQAIKDPILADTAAVATVSSLDANTNYMYTLGDQSGTIAADAGGKLVITKAQVKSTNAADGAKLTLRKEGSEAAAARVLAVYRPSQIFTWQDLQAMRQDLSGNYLLMKDIVFPLFGAEEFPTGFEPVGDESSAYADGSDRSTFKGTLDGNGKIITGLAIVKDASYFYGTGLFGKIKGPAKETEVVKNLTLHDPNIAGGKRGGTGALAGHFEYGTVRNVAVTVSKLADSAGSTKISGGTSTGGLIGSLFHGTLLQGQSDIRVSDSRDLYAGGLIGQCYQSSVIGHATGAVTGDDYAGGLVGSSENCSVTGYATGAVTGTRYLGGLIGRSDFSRVIGYATGAVTGNSHVGGFVGYSYGSSTITGYATGVVTGNSHVGGFVASNQVTIIGYARSPLDRAGGTATSFGVIIGDGAFNANSAVYYTAATKHKFSGVSTAHGTAITMNAGTAQGAFAKLTFGTAVGEWSWVKDGNWPAINLDPAVGGAMSKTEQPTAN